MKSILYLSSSVEVNSSDVCPWREKVRYIGYTESFLLAIITLNLL